MLAMAVALAMSPIASQACADVASCDAYGAQVDAACAAKNGEELIHLINHGPACPDVKRQARRCYDDIVPGGTTDQSTDPMNDMMDWSPTADASAPDPVTIPDHEE